MQCQHLNRVRCSKRWFTSEYFKQQYPQCIYVRTRVCHCSLYDLGRCIFGHPKKCSRNTHEMHLRMVTIHNTLHTQQPRETKVCQLHCVLITKENISRTHGAMHYSILMSIVQRVGNLPNERRSLLK